MCGQGCGKVRGRGKERTHLEVLRANTPSQLTKQLDLNLLKLDRLNNVQYLLNLIQKHDLLRRVNFGPILQQPLDHILCQTRVLFQKLHHTVGQLRVIQCQSFDFVEGDQSSGEERLVFLLEGQGESVDDGTEDFEQFGNPVVPFGFVDELVEDVIDRPTDKGAQVEEFSVDSVKGRLEEVALAGVFRVEQLEELQAGGSAVLARTAMGGERISRTCKTKP